MFVANLAPVIIVCGAAVVRGSGEHLTSAEITSILQCAMFAAGIGTCMQLYPVWKIGSKLPIVMGVSFTFLGSLLVISTNPSLGYEGMIGAVILGGIFEGLVGLSAKYWKRFLTPVVSACVVIAIGLSLLSVGMDSWGGGSGVEDFGAWYHLLVGTFTLIVCLISHYRLKGIYKNLNILVGLIFGYLLSVILTVTGIAPMVDFSNIAETIHQIGYFSIPKLVFFTEHMPVFDLGAFFGLFFYVFFAHTYIGESNTSIRRMRTAFRPTEDASYIVRKENQKKLAEYLKYKPFGEGLGLGGVEARKYGSRLTTLIPHDSFYVKTWMETGIVGLVLFLIIYVSALLRGCYLIMFRIKNNELRGILTAIACGIFGMMISAYGNAFFGQFPTGFIIILFLSVLINGEHIDQLLTEKLRTKK